eukprot:GEMP01042300.1.p1 GENE.GEMP01042300.1~~GEMP01042300.1.p1  ORF type:complete len:335 (+),score=40.50 GEMP01042300.1:116-1120(+)
MVPTHSAHRSSLTEAPIESDKESIMGTCASTLAVTFRNIEEIYLSPRTSCSAPAILEKFPDLTSCNRPFVPKKLRATSSHGDLDEEHDALKRRRRAPALSLELSSLGSADVASCLSLRELLSPISHQCAPYDADKGASSSPVSEDSRMTSNIILQRHRCASALQRCALSGKELTNFLSNRRIVSGSLLHSAQLCPRPLGRMRKAMTAPDEELRPLDGTTVDGPSCVVGTHRQSSSRLKKSASVPDTENSPLHRYADCSPLQAPEETRVTLHSTLAVRRYVNGLGARTLRGKECISARSSRCSLNGNQRNSAHARYFNRWKKETGLRARNKKDST